MKKKVPASKYAEDYDFPKEAIVRRIESGILDGVKEDGKWYVLRPGKPQPAQPSSHQEDAPNALNQAKQKRDQRTRKVVRYEGKAYIYSLVAILGVGMVSDLGGMLLYAEEGLPTGLGLRIAVVVMIWLKHRWVRFMIKLWSGFMAAAGALGLWGTSLLDPAEYQVSWWVTPFFVGMIGVGIVYFALANKYVKVETVPVE